MTSRREFLSGALGAFSAAVAQSVQSAERPKRLILVHGRSQQGRKPAEVQSEWMDAFRIGINKHDLTLPTELDVVLPFYGDVLDEFARQFDLPLTSDIQERGGKTHSEFLAFQAQVADQLRIKAGITDEQIDAEYGPNPRPRGPLNWEWVQAILRTLDKHGSGMRQTALEVFTRDVFLYTHHQGVRAELDRIVGNAFTNEPAVVVGHSLGSVVAYNVLRSDRRTSGIPLFVTIGSPLGIRAIRDQLRPLRFPSAVSSWYNAFDTRDFVALYPLDSDNFPVRPTIENFDRVRNQTDNRHGISGYLNDATIAKKILNTLIT